MEPRIPGEEATKIPYCALGNYRAKTNDPRTWTTFDEAWKAFCTGRFSGIGFMLAPPHVGVDLDGCRDRDTGIIAAAAMSIILALNSYSEISQSGCGVKTILRGAMPTPDGGGKNYNGHRPWSEGIARLEMYGRARMFALTGNRLACASQDIQERGAQLGQLYRRLYPPTPVPRRRFWITGDRENHVNRAAKYLAKMEPSISGQGGHNKLLAAACELARFGLVGPDAMPLLHEFNGRCQPPWPDRDLERKAREAQRLVGPRIGERLREAVPA
jgi:primase-polymerase (primpol)-like protein